MTTIVINVEDSTKVKRILDAVKLLNGVTKAVIKPSDLPYNQAFVKEIQKSRASKGKVVKIEELWK